MYKILNNNVKLITGLCLSAIFLVGLTGCQNNETPQNEPKTQQMQDLLALPNTHKLTTLSGTKISPEEQAQKEVLNRQLAECVECGQTREFRGYFTYFADAAVLQECASGRNLPITANIKMQNAYELNRSEPGAPLFFVTQGQLAVRPSMEAGLTQLELVVDGDNWYFQLDGGCE